jgi:hypothetical protein
LRKIHPKRYAPKTYPKKLLKKSKKINLKKFFKKFLQVFLERRKRAENFSWNPVKKVLLQRFSESLSATLPVVLIIIALSFTVAPMPNGVFVSFLVGATFLVVGMGLFNLGAQIAMLPIGEHIGAYIAKSRKLRVVVVTAFLIGVFITMAEPDLQVLANQIPAAPNLVLSLSVAAGVGLFLVAALLRMLFYIPLSHVLIACYILAFALAMATSRDFLSIAFDAGGVTTGPMTTPFILSLGLGVASIRNDKHASDDSFGLVALSPVGPILTVAILGTLYKTGGETYEAFMPGETATTREAWSQFADAASGLPHYVKETAFALAPIAIFFVVFQTFAFKLKARPFIKILIGLLYTFAGLTLFLSGVNVGFMPVGNFLGGALAGLEYNWIVIPITMLIGYFIVTAEPAIHVLNKQVEEITSGAIPAKAMKTGLSVGMCVSLGLSMIRIFAGIHLLWFLVPGYVFALALSFFVPKIFTAIAFDSGGVASGPMTATFLMPFAIGVHNRLGGVGADAFGVAAMVAMAPLITIQIMGLIYKIRLERAERDKNLDKTDDSDIID